MQYLVRIELESVEGQSNRDLQDYIENLVHEMDSFSMVSITVSKKDD